MLAWILLNASFSAAAPPADVMAVDNHAFARAELTRYLDEMGVEQANRPVFVFGNSESNRVLLDEHIKPNDDDGFIIAIKPEVVRLAGRSTRATLYATYAFLERQGCRFFAPGDLWEIVPERDQLSLPVGVHVESPSNVTREIGGGGPPGLSRGQAVDWSAKVRLNRRFALRPGLEPVGVKREALREAWRQRGGMQQWQWITHNFPFMFPPEEGWFERHPEYFAWYQGRHRSPGSDGKNYYGGGNLAMTHPDVIAHCAQFAVDWFNRHPKGEVVPMWPNDGAIYWDESPRAMKLGGKNFTPGPEGSMTRRMVTFAREVAKLVAKDHDEQRLILLPAYANYIEPLNDLEKLEDNIFVQYCYHGDYAHGPLHSPVNAKSVRQMRAWAAQAKHFGVWEYFLIGDFNQVEAAPVLLPLVFRVRDTMRFLEEIGSTRYFTQANPAYQTYNPLLFYALARYAWDPSLEAEALITDYSEHAFGAAAGKPMADFYLAMERACHASQWRPTTYAEVAVPSPLVFTPEVQERMSALLKQAESQTKTPVQAERLATVRQAYDATLRSLRVTELVDLSPDRPWRLARLNDAYLLHADGPTVEADRFDDVLRLVRDTGGGGPALQRVAFRAQRRAVPIAHLDLGPLSLAVVPGIGGRAVRLIDQRTGDNVFAEQTGQDELEGIGSAYFNYGGYEEYVGQGFAGPGWEQAFGVVSMTDRALTLRATGEDWTLDRSYTLKVNPPRLVIRSMLTNRSTVAQTLSLRGHPQLSLGGKAGQAVLYASGPDKPWARVDTLDGLHDQLRAIEGNGVYREAVWQPETERGLIWDTQVDSGPAMPRSYTFVADDQSYFQIERFSAPMELASNQSFTMTQTLIPLASERNLWPKGLDPLMALLPAPTQVPAKAGDGHPALTGKPEQFVPGPDGREAAHLTPGHRLLLRAPGLRREAGTIAGWVRQPADESAPAWLLTQGDNRDAWFAFVADDQGLTAIHKLGKVPYTEAGEAYFSMNTPWNQPTDGDATWKHVAFSWQAHADKPTAQVALWIDGKRVEFRPAVHWPVSLPAGPAAIGGNAAAAQAASDTKLSRLVMLNRSIDATLAQTLILAEPLDKLRKQKARGWILDLDGQVELHLLEGGHADD